MTLAYELVECFMNQKIILSMFAMGSGQHSGTGTQMLSRDLNLISTGKTLSFMNPFVIIIILFTK